MNIYDIAQQAGVSIATVSRVLNENNKVRPATRDKVRRAMEVAGYTPNVFARGLGLNSMKMIGVLCEDVADLYYASAVSELERLLQVEQYDVLLYCTGQGRAEKLRCLHRLVEKRVDAVFAIGSAFKDNLEAGDLRPVAQKLPVILLNAAAPAEGAYSVMCDEAAATDACVRALYRAGCRSLLYCYDKDTASGKAKRSGFERAVNALNLSSACAYVQVARTVEDAAIAVAGALQRLPHLDGIVTAEDTLAVGALQALAATGRKLPVIGFNNSILAQCTQPTLTSVDNMVQPLCAAAMQMLTALFKGQPTASNLLLAPRLVYRDSFPEGAPQRVQG